VKLLELLAFCEWDPLPQDFDPLALRVVGDPWRLSDELPSTIGKIYLGAADHKA
jgi:hypothetical protein